MYQRYCKRLLDFVLSLAACIVLAPVMLVIAVWIKLDYPGPVFFRQRRVEEDLKEHIPQFFFQVVHVFPVDGIDNFIDFLDEIGAQGLMGLGAVPGAASGGQKAVHRIVQGGEVIGRCIPNFGFAAVEEDGLRP